ncbi:MAG TPA: hypothetical protein VF174_13645 [Micromonosporaceae bacterium]
MISTVDERLVHQWVPDELWELVAPLVPPPPRRPQGGGTRTTLYKALPELMAPEQAKARLAAQIGVLPADQRALPSVEAYDKLLTQRAAEQP